MIKAKKKYGQNFLKDDSILTKIIQAMPNDNHKIIEIGPGLGDLTNKLLHHNKRVTAIEIDLELCSYLKDKFSDEIEQKQIELVCNDVIDKWNSGSLSMQPYHLVANLPYYIATNLILKALDDKRCQTIIVMVQKEVAVKFSSKVGDKRYSALSILADSIGKAEILFDVESKFFDPPPKVTSAVLKITKFSNYDNLFEKKGDIENFKSFLKIAFLAPRKTLIKNLSQKYDKQHIIECFENFDISLNLRPHQLKSNIYHLLFKNLK